MSAAVRIRMAEESDTQTILDFIIGLAAYQDMEAAVQLDSEQLLKDGFGKNPAFEVLIAEVEHTPVGMALYYQRYSTWRGKMMYLEDIFVSESARNAQVGSQLMDRLGDIAKERGCVAMAWQVADWNTDAIRLYERRGAKVSKDWFNCIVEL